jgi:hypothetical protein
MPASIFAGSKVKTLKSTLSLNGGADIISSTTNPQTSAISAEPGSLLLNTTSGTMYRKLDAGATTNWVEVGAGTGGKNYIKNHDFDGGATTSWSMQKVSLSSFIPTGNIGAADAGHTIATSGSSPLEGANSLLVQGASAFTAGNCLVSAAFTIDREDVAKVMGWSFAYEAITTNMDFSGTTGNTWAVYIAEVTTSTPDTVVSWIQPAGVYNLVQGSGVGLAAGTFQTTATESSAYRIVLVCINSEAAATTLKVDDFQLGPQRVVYGSPVTDWQSFTPTPVGFTASAIEGKYRRVGDSIEVRVRAVMATVTSGAFSVSAPFPADSTKYPSAAVNSFYGTGGYYDTTANQGYIGTSFITSGASPVIGVYGPTGSQWQAAGVPVAFGAGDILTVEITYPAAGLSSSVQMSNDTDTRVVAARIEKNGNQASITSDVVLTTWSVSHDTTASWDVVNNKYTFPVSGVYKIDGIGTFDNVAGTSRVLQYRINGGSWQRFTEIISSGASNFTICTVNTQLSVSAGSYIEFGAASGTSVAFRGNSATTPSWFNINRLSGPATIAASETVAMRYSTSAAPSISNNSATAITFGTRVFDTHGAYSGSIYTVPVSGKYRFSMALYSVATAASMTDFQIICYKNGAQAFGANFPKGGTSTTPGGGNLSGTIDCVAGDTLQGRWLQTSGGSLALIASGDWNWISIERVGN